MNPQTRQKRRIETTKIVGIYALFGLAWIYGSDTVLGWLVHDPVVMVKIAVVKGSLFILCTATLLYFLINRFIRQLTAAETLQIESLRNYEVIFNATNEAIFVHDARSGRILDINDRMLDFFGYTRDEALNVDIGSLSEGTSPYSQVEAVEMVHKALFEGPQVFEWLARKKSGELFWTEVSLRRITPNDSDRIIAVARDISDRKRMDDVLRAREERQRIILDSAMDGFWVVSQQGRLLEVNEAYCRMSGYGKEEILTMGIADFEVNETAAATVDHIEKLMAQGEDRFVTQHRRKDGSVFDVEVSARYIPAYGGLIVGFHTDITALKNSTRILELYRNALDNARDSIFLVGEDARFLFVNQAACESLGYSYQELLTMHVYDIDPDFPRDVWQKLWKDLEKQRTLRVEARQETRGGQLIPMEIGLKLFSFEGVEYLVAAARDQTERIQLDEERHKLEKQILQAQKLESLGVLAGGIAHDFNNILTAIMGNISYARMDHDASQHAYEPLVRAEKAAQRAAGLAKQLLAFSKGGEPIKRLISVRQSVEDAVSLVMSGSSVEAVIDLPTDLHAVNADEGQLSQAFHNIIINAVQAMPDGGRLTVSARNVAITGENSPGLAAGDYVEILFADEGCGIAAEDLERIFDPYFTSKADGSGLGLASTYTVIKKHSGHISVSSAPGKGTIFTILLPGCGEPVSEDPQEAQPPGAAHGVYSILVMDDDEMVRELADITLKRFGYEVVCCDNGAAAVSLYRTTREEGVPFSLVIMDLTIPGGMGGIEAARQILAFDPEAKLIVSSGYSDDPVMASFADYGFCAALEKPYNVEEIVRILQRTQREAPT